MRCALLVVAAMTASSCANHQTSVDEDPIAHTPTVPEIEAMPDTEARGIYAETVQSLEGEAVDLGAYADQVTLVVNVASECGYTPQYAGLQALHNRYASRGFAVLGFPSNEFGGQEPGSPEQIRTFCSNTYGVTFPLFAKCETQAGDGQSPVYAALGAATGELPGWNFGKYLVGKDGAPLRYFEPGVAPGDDDLNAAIEQALGG